MTSADCINVREWYDRPASPMPINLSCGNCKATRPFSVMPLACETCGWAYANRTTNTPAPTIPPISTRARVRRTAQDILRGVGIAVLSFAGIAALLGITYTLIDYVPQTREIPVYFKAYQWIPGAFEDCYSTVEQKDEVSMLVCGDSNEEHEMNVEFYGDLKPDRNKTWKCQRGQTSITCKLQ